MESWTGSTVMDWEPGENGSDNLEYERDVSSLTLVCDSEGTAVRGLTSSADGEMLNGRVPCTS